MPEIKFSIFDFDGTIYRHDSMIDFWFFLLSKNILLLVYLPWQMLIAFLYLCHLISIEKFKEDFLIFTKYYSLSQIKDEVDKFWRKNYNKINTSLIQAIVKDQKEELLIICISASPSFILQPIMEKLKINKLLATNYNLDSHRLIGRNCKGSNKFTILNSWFDGNYKNQIMVVQKMYTDSLADKPLLDLAIDKYIVKKGKISVYQA